MITKVVLLGSPSGEEQTCWTSSSRPLTLTIKLSAVSLLFPAQLSVRKQVRVMETTQAGCTQRALMSIACNWIRSTSIESVNLLGLDLFF